MFSLVKRFTYMFSKNPSHFIALSNTTLQNLSTKLDSIQDTMNIQYTLRDGVLTISTANNKLVINRQIPNEQIWYSSIKSGPQRFNYVQGQWVNSKGLDLQAMMLQDIKAN